MIALLFLVLSFSYTPSSEDFVVYTHNVHTNTTDPLFVITQDGKFAVFSTQDPDKISAFLLQKHANFLVDKLSYVSLGEIGKAVNFSTINISQISGGKITITGASFSVLRIHLPARPLKIEFRQNPLFTVSYYNYLSSISSPVDYTGGEGRVVCYPNKTWEIKNIHAVSTSKHEVFYPRRVICHYEYCQACASKPEYADDGEAKATATVSWSGSCSVTTPSCERGCNWAKCYDPKIETCENCHGSADFAEYLPKEKNYTPKPGDLIGISPETGKARKYQEGDLLAGIYSEHPLIKAGKPGKDKVLVGLVGQLKVNKSQVIIKNRIVYTKDKKWIVGYLLDDNETVVLRKVRVKK